MKMEHMVFLDSVFFLPRPLCKLPEAFGLTASKSWYPHYFNTEENLNYLGPIPDVSYYGVNVMGKEERRDFLVCYESRKPEPSENRRVLETYCQDHVPILRQPCRVFRRELMQIGYTEVYPEAITIASACNNVLRKRLLQHDTIALLPTVHYTCNNKYSKKNLMWLLHIEPTDGVKIMYARNTREYKLPELPRFSVDRYCHEINKIFEFFGLFFTGTRARSLVTSAL